MKVKPHITVTVTFSEMNSAASTHQVFAFKPSQNKRSFLLLQ